MGMCSEWQETRFDSSGDIGMLREYFEKQKAKLLEREEDAKQELEILDSAIKEILFTDISAEEKVKLAKFINGSQERNKGRLKVLEERKAIVSRLLEVIGDI